MTTNVTTVLSHIINECVWNVKCRQCEMSTTYLNEISETKSEKFSGAYTKWNCGKDRPSSTTRMLESILKTLQTWERIPKDIFHKVNKLKVQIKEEIQEIKDLRLFDENKSRKICPLFANRKRKTEARSDKMHFSSLKMRCAALPFFDWLFFHLEKSSALFLFCFVIRQPPNQLYCQPNQDETVWFAVN